MTASFFNLNATFAVELVVFILVLAVLARFVIKPLQAAMRRRQDQIADSMAKAQRVKELLAAAEADYQTTLDQARKQARTIIETARQIADHTVRDATQTSDHSPVTETAHDEVGLETSRS